MGYRWPQCSSQRGQLQSLVVRTVKQRLGEDALVCGHHLGNYENTGDGRVLLQFIERKTGAVLHSRSTDCVIAADGIHSRVRAMHYPDEGMPRWNGAILWRGVTESGQFLSCLLYTSDAADERSSVDLGGRRIIKKKTHNVARNGQSRIKHTPKKRQ